MKQYGSAPMDLSCLRPAPDPGNRDRDGDTDPRKLRRARLRTTAPRQWWLAPNCSSPSTPAAGSGGDFASAAPFPVALVVAPLDVSSHLWCLSAVGTGFPFLGQGHRGAGTMPNRV